MTGDAASGLKRSVADEARELTVQIVAARVAHNTVAVRDLPALIDQVYNVLAGLRSPLESAQERSQPAVPVRKSVTSDWIICLEDGRKLRMLKRHLRTAYNMTPDEYRERWGLPSDYPMVAPNYSTRRSALAKAAGLGTRRPATGPASVPQPAAPSGRRGRGTA
ncbi:MucR family transcriptional regulator [Inquilinus sp. OTU3971]|uniref:MucR family transcriptional regulator n=1 Tax=Inquilinus sp. OTU3971 TaxID=3043855 RepID=UPI00313DDC29